MKKFLMPFFLLGALSVGFTSCGSDDDDDNAPQVAAANVTITVNGEESPKEVTLTRGTIFSKEGTAGKDDILKFNLSTADGSKIKKVQILINNSFESNVAATDENGIVYNDKFTYETPSTEKNISLVGVYAKYTIKITTDKGATKTATINVVNDKDNYAYNGTGSSSKRYLSNKQTVVLDAEGKEYSNKFNYLTYYVKTGGGITKKNFGNASLYSVDETQYENWQGSKGDFELEASKLKFISDIDLNDSIEYLVYKIGDYYFLIHILSIKDNIIKFDVQY